MAFQFANRLEVAGEQTMRDLFGTLSEKDQRRFAAFEAQQRGHGGIHYVAEVLGCSRRTIERGIAELADLPNDPAAGRIRRPGAGRPAKITPDSEVEQNLQSVLETRTGGDPDDEKIIFTDLSPLKLAETVAKLGRP